MSKQAIERLYKEAGQANHQAKSILDEYDGKDMPQEKENEVQALFDAYDEKVARAQKYEKALENSRAFDVPANELPSPSAGGTGEGAADGDLHLKAYRKVLKSGERALNSTEQKALQADSDAAGGFLVMPQQMSTRLIKALDNEVFIRQLSTVEQVTSADSLGIVSLDADPDDADWTSELGTGNEDSSMEFGKRELRPKPLAKLAKITKNLIRRSTRDVEALVQDRLVYKFAVTQEKAFLTGTGQNQPLGVFVASNDGIPIGRDVVAASATAFTADEVIDTQYGCKAQYMKSGVWVAHRETIKRVRKLKDSQGQYLWQAGLASGQPATILDRPYYMSEYAPNTYTSGLYTLIFGDFKVGYTIAEVLGMQIQVLLELYARSGQNGYLGRLEVDGQPVLAEAFSRLRLG